MTKYKAQNCAVGRTGTACPQPTSPAGSYQPSAQPAHLRRQRHAAGQQEQGQTAARSSPRPYRQRGRPAGEQERRSRSGAGKPPQEPHQPHPATPPAANPGQQTNHAQPETVQPIQSNPAPAPPESNRNRPPCCASILLLERMQNQRPRNPRRATGDSPARQQ